MNLRICCCAGVGWIVWIRGLAVMYLYSCYPLLCARLNETAILLRTNC
jgi:energy-converting hydrogenase Eha subunit G